jgi:hypothetical protein
VPFNDSVDPIFKCHGVDSKFCLSRRIYKQLELSRTGTTTSSGPLDKFGNIGSPLRQLNAPAPAPLPENLSAPTARGYDSSAVRRLLKQAAAATDESLRDAALLQRVDMRL